MKFLVPIGHCGRWSALTTWFRITLMNIGVQLSAGSYFHLSELYVHVDYCTPKGHNLAKYSLFGERKIWSRKIFNDIENCVSSIFLWYSCQCYRPFMVLQGRIHNFQSETRTSNVYTNYKVKTKYCYGNQKKTKKQNKQT